MNSRTLPPDAATRLEALATHLALPDFDLLLVGDGSGTVRDRPSGWACIAYDRRSEQVYLQVGAMSCGTNNFAELAPFVQALWSYEQTRADTAVVRVSIISDSELTVRCGNGQYARRANGCLWSAVEWFEKHGYQLSWRHVPRNSNAFNALADRVAGFHRLLLDDSLDDVPSADLRTNAISDSVMDGACSDHQPHESRGQVTVP